jgi:hypothetical protein
MTITSSAYAGTSDLKVFNILLKSGASSEQFMSKIHVGFNDIECRNYNYSKEYECTMIDISANEGTGGHLVLTDKKAEFIFKLLKKNGALPNNGIGKVYINANSIRCNQAVTGAADGTDADRTSCLFEITVD